MPDETPQAAPPVAPATPPAAEGQQGGQESQQPPKTIPYERFAEVVAERNALRDEKATGTWQKPPESPQEPIPAPYVGQPYGAGAPGNPWEALNSVEDRLGLARGELMQAFTPALVNALSPVVQTAFTTFEETRKERDPYFGIYEQPYRNYVRQGYAPDMAMRLARGDKVNEIATKMTEDRAKASAHPVGRFTGEPAAPGAEGPNGLTQGQELLADQLGLDADERKIAAAERAKRLQR